MPPWPADPHFGKFSNDRSLSREEIDMLVAWADGGAREGDPAEAPKPAQFVDGWGIHKPDVVFEMPNEFAGPRLRNDRLPVHRDPFRLHRRQMGAGSRSPSGQPPSWCITSSPSSARRGRNG